MHNTVSAAEAIAVSSAHRQGIDELIEEVIGRLPEEGTSAELDSDPARIRIAFIGRPNVGKSTLVNRLLGEERMIASDVPGTTRDSVAIDMERDGRLYRLIDTAGLRRKSRVDEAVEKFSIIKTLHAIEQCQVAVIMLDAGEGVTDQDASVLGYALDAGRALVVAVNKWDGQTDYQRQQAESLLARKLSFVDWAEAVRISAKHGSGLGELFKAIHRAHTNRLRTLSESYKRYLENFFRKRFKLVGTPVRFIFKEGANPYEGKKNVLTTRQVAKKQRLIRRVKRGK